MSADFGLRPAANRAVWLECLPPLRNRRSTAGFTAATTLRPMRPKMLGPARWRALGEIGAGEKSRTPDLRITNALLYQLSYTGAGKRAL